MDGIVLNDRASDARGGGCNMLRLRSFRKAVGRKAQEENASPLHSSVTCCYSYHL